MYVSCKRDRHHLIAISVRFYYITHFTLRLCITKYIQLFSTDIDSDTASHVHIFRKQDLVVDVSQNSCYHPDC